MSNRDAGAFLEDMLSSSKKIQKYIESKTCNDFIRDELLIDGIIRNLEIIGEATKMVPINVRKKYPYVEWKKMAGFKRYPHSWRF